MPGSVHGHWIRLCICLLTLFSLCEPSKGQEQEGVSPYGAQEPLRGERHTQPVMTYALMRGDSLVVRQSVDPEEELSVIVQFQTPPVAIREKLSSPVTLSQAVEIANRVEEEHASFHAALTRILGGSSISRAAHQVSAARGEASAIQREFRQLFNGAALQVPRWAVGEIQKLSYVKSVTPDRLLKATDASANHIVRADTLRARYALTGKGIRIGFLDTGLDYSLTAFGGGLGIGYRVHGGYDFVNNDPDPMDDNGHGTEVASLAAASAGSGDSSSATTGVAPEATLYAYKVLNEKGEGVSSVALAALEQALADSVQIVNLSFGSTGDPSDPLSVAVDNASRAGVLAVAAAGNAGPAYQTIGSPGCAKAALTVGASDFTDQLTDFSSCGPTDLAFTVKPDLIAPGVSLAALTQGGSTVSASGSSYAAALVTGGAALLKELHRTWTPEMLKSALMAGAKDVGYDLWREGKGRVDLLTAGERHVLIIPQSVSLGFDEMTLPQWVRRDTLRLMNLTGTPQSYHIELPTGLPAGIFLSLEPSSDLTLSPDGGESSIILTTRVDNDIVQIPATNPPAITGMIRCVGTDDTLLVPFALLLGSSIDLDITTTLASPVVCFAHSDGTVYRSSDVEDMRYSQGKWTVRRLVKPGAYDICAQLGYIATGLTWLTRDSVVVNPSAKVVMNESEALYTVGTIPKDEYGGTLDSVLLVNYSMRMYSRRTSQSFGGILWRMYYGSVQFLNKLPQASANWVYDYCSLTDQTREKVYSSAGQLLGPFTSDHVVDLKEGDYTKRTIDYRFHRPVEQLTSVDFFAFEDDIFGWGWYSAQNPTTLASPFHQEWYATGEPVGNFPFNQWYFNLQELFSYSGIPPFTPDKANFLMLTPNQHPGVDGVLRTSFLWSKDPTLETRRTSILYGLGPRFYFGRTANAETMLKVKTNTWLGVAWTVGGFAERHLPLFLNQAMDYTPVSLKHRLFDSQGQLLDSGITPEGFWEELTSDGHYYERSLVAGLSVPGRYTFEIIDTTSWVLNHRGFARVLLTQDTRHQDKNPPSMASFEILADSERTDQILPGQKAELQTVVTDQEGPLQDVKLYYRAVTDTLWHTLPLTQLTSARYSNRDLALLPEAYISLRLVATDAAGNVLDYRAEPAFYSGTYQNHAPVPSTELRPNTLDTVQLYTVPKAINFRWKQALDPDLDTLRSQIHLWGIALDTTLTALTDTIAFATLPALVPGASYAWTVTSSDGQLAVTSDTAHFRTASRLLALKEEALDLPKTLALKQNSPNPFNPTTTISYDLPRACNVSLTVYDVVGREVQKLVMGEMQPAGRYRVTFNGERLASGVYFYRLVAGSFVETKKLLLVR